MLIACRSPLLARGRVARSNVSNVLFTAHSYTSTVARSNCTRTSVVGTFRKMNSMTQRKAPPRRPMIAICGSTGTGKSQLAVEVAGVIGDKRSAAEIISADSMQMYRGLDVITNKVTMDEMNGVAHHLINVLDPALRQECDINTFIAQANTIIDKLYARHRVPIVVGGTSYYIQHLLLPGSLIASAENDDPDDACRMEKGKETKCVEDVVAQHGVSLTDEQWRLLRRIVARTDVIEHTTFDAEALPLWQLLQRLDPAMAARWHFRDTRKVLRSIRVLVETGKRQSDWIAEQREKHDEPVVDAATDGAAATAERVDRLVIWLHCDRDVLMQRLDARVDKMIERGLLQEIVSLRTIAAAQERSTGMKTDFTRGIFQAIGYKEFDAYLTHCEKQEIPCNDDLSPLKDDIVGEQLFAQALEAMKIATRRYAKRQVSWLRSKLVPAIEQTDERCHVVVLDGSDLTKWTENVSRPAYDIVQAFLDGHATLPAVGISVPEPKAVAKTSTAIVDGQERDELLGFEVCPTCSQQQQQQQNGSTSGEPYMVMRAHWNAHLRGRVHRSALRHRGLVARRGPDTSEAAQAKREARQARKTVHDEQDVAVAADEQPIDRP